MTSDYSRSKVLKLISARPIDQCDAARLGIKRKKKKKSLSSGDVDYGLLSIFTKDRCFFCFFFKFIYYFFIVAAFIIAWNCWLQSGLK